MKIDTWLHLQGRKSDVLCTKVDVFKVIDDLYEEMDKNATSCTYTLDGETITTDVGYAYLGIEFFIKNLKKRLGGEAE